MCEVMAAIFDFAELACDRYPRREQEIECGFNVILRWAMPNQTWSRFGWFIWLSFGPYMVMRCLYLTLAARADVTNGIPLLSLHSAIVSPFDLVVSVLNESSSLLMMEKIVFIFVFYGQLILFVPWALYTWSNVALLKSSLQRWSEKIKPGQVYPGLNSN